MILGIYGVSKRMDTHKRVFQALLQEGKIHDIVVYNRTKHKADQLAKDVGGRSVGYNELISCSDYVLVSLPPKVAYTKTLEIVSQGVNVILETPGIFHKNQIKRIETLGKNHANVFLLEEFPFMPVYQLMKKIVGNKKIFYILNENKLFTYHGLAVASNFIKSDLEFKKKLRVTKDDSSYDSTVYTTGDSMYIDNFIIPKNSLLRQHSSLKLILHDMVVTENGVCTNNAFYPFKKYDGSIQCELDGEVHTVSLKEMSDRQNAIYYCLSNILLGNKTNWSKVGLYMTEWKKSLFYNYFWKLAPLVEFIWRYK